MSRSILILVALLIIPCWVIGWLYEIDINTAYWVISRIFADPLKIYGEVNGNAWGRYYYAPFSLVVFSPLAGLSFSTFKIVWLSLQTVSYVAFWWLLIRLYPGLFQNTWRALFVWVVAINPIHNNFQSNNIQLMLAVVLLTAEYLSRQKTKLGPFVAGLLLAGATHVKVYPLFLAGFYFLRGPTRVRSGIVAGAIGFALMPFVFFGPQNGTLLYEGFLRNMTVYAVDNPLTRVNDILCLPSLIARTLQFYLSSQTISLVTSTLTVIISLAFFYWTWRVRATKNLWELAWLLMAFLNPSTRVHYFIFLIPAFCLWANTLNLKNKASVIGFAASLGLIAFTVEGVVGRSLNNLLEHWNLPTWGILIAILFSVRNVRAISYR